MSDAVTKFAFLRTYAAAREASDRGEDAGLELLLHAEIESKGQSEESAGKLGEWIRRTYSAQLADLSEDERERRIEMLCRAMGWPTPRKSGEE